jgi:hypothetical protein
MYEKKQAINKTPDLSKMQAVVIDSRTVIYIPEGSDAKEAKKRYLERPSVYKKP